MTSSPSRTSMPPPARTRVAFDFAAAVAFAALAVAPAHAQLPPAVGIGPNADVHIGHGFLMTYEDQCIAVTAAHVVQGRSRVSLTRGESAGEVYQGEVIARDEEPTRDVALIRIVENRPSSCGRDYTSPAVFSGRAQASVRRVDTGGALMPKPAVLADVAPASDLVMFHGDVAKGNSGALIEIDGRPAGMMLEVDRELPLSRALRFDRLTVMVRAMLERAPAPARAGATAGAAAGAGNPAANLASQSVGARVLRQLPPTLVDAESGAFRLLQDGSAGHWLAKLAPGVKAEIDIQLGGATSPVVTEVRLLRGLVPAADLARQVEVLTSDEGFDNMSSRGVITLAPDRPDGKLSLSPRPVRYVRLRVIPRDDANPVHGLARVEVR